VNFVHRGVAMNYQSAFADPSGAKDKPGLLCHAAAVGHYAGRGLDRYSFLAGKDRYKQSLSTCEERLEWWLVERFSPRLEAEALLRRLLRRPASA
jgi:CelD/BcsL family acetyltransferase involved in cellulose biosynthesis